MFAKSSVVLAFGLSSVLVAANPHIVAKADIQYPAGMPSECIPYYVPPTVCPSIPAVPTTTPVKPSTPVPPASIYTPPASTYTPPASSYTPPASSHTPPASTYTPPASTYTPPASTYTPPASSHTPPASTYTPPASTYTPPASTYTPPASTYTPTTTITVTATPTATHISQCNTGNAQCCNTVQKSSDASAAGVLGLVGVALSGVDALVGLGCTPINVLGLGQGANCAQQPVCCSNNTYNGLVNIGCSPISL